MRLLPFVRRQIEQELEKTRVGLQEDVLKANKGILFRQNIPKSGLGEVGVLELVDTYMQMNASKWEEGTVSGCVFNVDDTLTRMTTRIYEKFAWSNSLFSDVFPDVRKMEAEVVRMVCNLFNGDDETCGTVSDHTL